MDRLKRWLAPTLLCFFLAGTAQAVPRDFPRPQALAPDIEFWTRIYSEVGTDGGLIHDSRDLGVVYEVVRLPRGARGKARERHTDRIKKKYKTILLELAKGKRSGLSREQARVLGLFGRDVSNSTLRDASKQLRFQLGQADKFRAGLIRSGAYKPHILSVLRDMELPLEIAHLPHVESSYTPNVYSRVGAAGLWQFTRSTGRRFMQVNHVVDERLDPYIASIAAARLLEQNFRVTGAWPLAITAYNHGAAGMRRAARKLGTKDITTIVRKYKSRTFGFASRNFYVEFLAADAVASEAERHFGKLTYDTPISFEQHELPYYARAKDLARAIGIDVATLKKANPALRPAVWRGEKYVPRGFEIKVPRAHLARPIEQALRSLPKDQRYAQQTRDASYTVRRGDTLSKIAGRHGVRTSELVALNGLRSKHRIHVGQKLKLPARASGTPAAKATPSKSRKTERVVARTERTPTALPAALPPDGLYVVKRGDNLTRIADRFGITVAELVRLNRLRSRNRIAAGQTLRVAAAPALEKVAAASTPPTPAEPPTPRPAPAKEPIVLAEPTAPPAPPVAEPPSAPDASNPIAALADAPALDEPVETPALEEPSSDESAVEPSPGLLADPSDYTVASNGTIEVQANETLGHFAEWLGLRASRLRQLNRLRFGQPVTVQQRLRLDFSQVRPEDFERVRVEYHRALQEAFFAEWEIEGTRTHRVGPGDSLWLLSTRRFDVPIWLLRQYNPDVDLDALSTGTVLTVPKLRQRTTASTNPAGDARA